VGEATLRVVEAVSVVIVAQGPGALGTFWRSRKAHRRGRNLSNVSWTRLLYFVFLFFLENIICTKNSMTSTEENFGSKWKGLTSFSVLLLFPQLIIFS
jgi:hypothetical protein